MDGPEEAHLVAGAVEEVVAAVQQEGGEEPGEGAGPGEAHHSVLLVQAGVTPQHQHPRQERADGSDACLSQWVCGGPGPSPLQVGRPFLLSCSITRIENLQLRIDVFFSCLKPLLAFIDH